VATLQPNLGQGDPGFPARLNKSLQTSRLSLEAQRITIFVMDVSCR